MDTHLDVMRRASLLTVLLLLLVGGGRSLAAQASHRPVVIATLESFPDIEARSMIVRDRGRDVVLLRADDATADVLGMALIVLEGRREEEPTPAAGQMIPITGFAYTTELHEGQRDRLDRTLARLARRPVREIGSFGPGRWIRYRVR